MSGIWPRSATAPWNWTMAPDQRVRDMQMAPADPFARLPVDPQPDARTLAAFIGPADIRAFLRVYRSATRPGPWTGVGPAPIADPTTPHARVEAWLAALSEA